MFVVDLRLFALDILGFGRSPKPRDCFYTLEDHLGMIEKSIINSFELKSFHLVAHSMGCILALALASKYSNSVKSITLVAPVSSSYYFGLYVYVFTFIYLFFDEKKLVFSKVRKFVFKKFDALKA